MSLGPYIKTDYEKFVILLELLLSSNVEKLQRTFRLVYFTRRCSVGVDLHLIVSSWTPPLKVKQSERPNG